MPTTQQTKPEVVPIRITPAMRRQLDDLIALGYGTQSDVIRLAVDRMHQRYFGPPPPPAQE